MGVSVFGRWRCGNRKSVVPDILRVYPRITIINVRLKSSGKVRDSKTTTNISIRQCSTLHYFSSRWHNHIKLFLLTNQHKLSPGPLYHLSVYIQAGKWSRKSRPVMSHSVITVSKSLLLWDKQHSCEIAHCCRDKCTCLLVCKKMCMFCMHVSDYLSSRSK